MTDALKIDPGTLDVLFLDDMTDLSSGHLPIRCPRSP